MYEDYDVIIVGCGLSGCTLAERFANVLNKKVIILEKRSHIGGNCYDYIEKNTGILMNKYGAHLFHTNYERVWDYINKFDIWVRWEHKVLSLVDNKFVRLSSNVLEISYIFFFLAEFKNNISDDDNFLFGSLENGEFGTSSIIEILHLLLHLLSIKIID